DLNYVEKLPEAREQGRILEISEDLDDNPNYFFPGYQRKGDKYNPPNRHPNMHVRSWENIKNVLGSFPARIRNLNPGSALKCFEFGDAGDILRTIDAPFRQLQDDVESALQYDLEREFWREQILQEIAECRDATGVPVAAGQADTLDAQPWRQVEIPEVQVANFEMDGQCEELADRVWRFHENGPHAKLLLSIDVRNEIANKPLVANLWLSASSRSFWRLRLARRGEGRFESTFRTTHPGPEVQCIQIRKEFAENHGALRLEVQCLEAEGVVDLTLVAMATMESISSLRKRLDGSLPGVSVPNRLFRAGNYNTALGIYLALHCERGLAMYGN